MSDPTRQVGRLGGTPLGGSASAGPAASAMSAAAAAEPAVSLLSMRMLSVLFCDEVREGIGGWLGLRDQVLRAPRSRKSYISGRKGKVCLTRNFR